MKYLVRYWLYLFFEAKFPNWFVSVIRLVSFLVIVFSGFPKSTIRAVDLYVNQGDFKSIFRFWLFMLSFRLKWLRGRDSFFFFFEALDAVLAEQLYEVFSRKKLDVELEIWMAGLAEVVLFSILKKGEKCHYKTDNIWYQHYLRHKNSIIDSIKVHIETAPKVTKSAKYHEKKLPGWIKFYLDNKQLSNFSNIVQLTAMANKAGLKLFPVAGTLLGLIREGSLLSHDIDCDMGCFWDKESFKEFLRLINESPGFSVKKSHHKIYKKVIGNQVTYQKEDIPILIKIHCEKGTHIDIFSYVKTVDQYVMGSSLHSWVYQPFEVEEQTFNGYKLYVPSDAKGFLTQTYGRWQIENKAFSYHTDTPNMRNAGTVIAEVYNFRLALKLADIDRAEAEKVLASIDR
ncbi:hypothetical protein OAQ81_01785 [Candidatus Thioglobus sp.]|nr:hypothetical protein [Candidatus Thioglobus sp.]